MIGVSLRPCSSSAARSAPTRPSIMSLGASASAPAAASDTAVRASSSSVRSLSTTPSSRSTPQWPWLVYSHRHRSGITSRSGFAALIARVASWTTPSSSHAPEPSSSFAAGQPEEHHRRDPERRGLAGLLGGGRDREVVDARQARDRRAAVGAVADEHRIDQMRRRELRLAHHRPQQAGAPEAPHAGGGKHVWQLRVRRHADPHRVRRRRDHPRRRGLDDVVKGLEDISPNSADTVRFTRKAGHADPGTVEGSRSTSGRRTSCT